MEIVLYKTLDAKNKLTKQLTDENRLHGTLRDSSNINNPSILLQTSPLDYNYAYIPEFGRYYFINSTTAVRNQAFIITLKTDVLMTYSEEIKKLSALIDRTDGNSDDYIAEGFVVDARETEEVISYPEKFTEPEWILVTMKGGGE